MPAVIEQINAMSMADKMQIMKYLVAAIEKAVSSANVPVQTKRSLSPDPTLRCKINCDLFEDSSDEWESA